MRTRVRPWAAFCLCIAVWLVQVIGLVHATLHVPEMAAAQHASGHVHPEGLATASSEGHAHASFGSHDEGDTTCLVLDGLLLAHPQAESSPAPASWSHITPAARLRGGCITPFAAGFQARGPPLRG